MDPEVLYCDNHLLVLEKPAGMLTQPNESEDDSLEAFGKRYLKERFSKPGNVFLEAVHRLDRPVSGVVVFARTSKALSRLNKAQREGLFHKRYIACVEGNLSDGEFVDYLLHDSHRAVVDPKGKRCVLHYHVLEHKDGMTLVEIDLKTGRYHQIRAQFAHNGHPIVGDVKYGSKREAKRVLLQHHILQAPHPISGEILTFKAKNDLDWA